MRAIACVEDGSALPCLAGGVALIAQSFELGLILDDAGDAIFLGDRVSLCLGLFLGLGGFTKSGSLRQLAFVLFLPQALPFRSSLLAVYSNRQPFRTSRSYRCIVTLWRVRELLEKLGFGFSCALAALKEVVLLLVFHTRCPFLFRRWLFGLCSQQIVRIAVQPQLLQAGGFGIPGLIYRFLLGQQAASPKMFGPNLAKSGLGALTRFRIIIDHLALPVGLMKGQILTHLMFGRRQHDTRVTLPALIWPFDDKYGPRKICTGVKFRFLMGGYEWFATREPEEASDQNITGKYIRQIDEKSKDQPL